MHTTIRGAAGEFQQFVVGGGERWLRRHEVADAEHHARRGNIREQHPGLPEGIRGPQAKATRILHTQPYPRERDQRTVRPGDKR